MVQSNDVVAGRGEFVGHAVHELLLHEVCGEADVGAEEAGRFARAFFKLEFTVDVPDESILPRRFVEQEREVEHAAWNDILGILNRDPVRIGLHHKGAFRFRSDFVVGERGADDHPDRVSGAAEGQAVNRFPGERETGADGTDSVYMETSEFYMEIYDSQPVPV